MAIVRDVTIEIPAGSRVKYEIDHETHRLRLDRVLFTPMQYPTHYGYLTPSVRTATRWTRWCTSRMWISFPALWWRPAPSVC